MKLTFESNFSRIIDVAACLSKCNLGGTDYIFDGIVWGGLLKAGLGGALKGVGGFISGGGGGGVSRGGP